MHHCDIVWSYLCILSALLINAPLWEVFEKSPKVDVRDTYTSSDSNSDSDSDSDSASDTDVRGDSSQHRRTNKSVHIKEALRSRSLNLLASHKVHRISKFLAETLLTVFLTGIVPEILSQLHVVVGAVMDCLVSCARIDPAFVSWTYEVEW